MGTVKKSSVYDRKIKTYKSESEYIDGADYKTFDDLIEKIKSLKQKYLEHEFLYKRTVSISSREYYIKVNITGIETDGEYEKRIKRYEKSKLTQAANAEKRREAVLKKKIEEFKKLKKSLENVVDINSI